MWHICKFLLVVLLASILDACWTFAIIYTSEKKNPILASLWTGLGYLISAINVITYVHDRIMIAAVVIGSMLGCFFTIKFMKKNNCKI